MNTSSPITQERILRAAVELFSKVGYSGASTRDIARRAEVNEVTVYRYYPRKHDLFLAALETEFQNLRVNPELLARLANAADLRSALGHMFGMIQDAVTRQPQFIRLLQFTALELGANLEPLLRRHVGEMLDLSVSYLQRWKDSGELKGLDPKVIILGFVATVVGVETFYEALWGQGQQLHPEVTNVNHYTEMWLNTLTNAPVSMG